MMSIGVFMVFFGGGLRTRSATCVTCDGCTCSLLVLRNCCYCNMEPLGMIANIRHRSFAFQWLFLDSLYSYHYRFTSVNVRKRKSSVLEWGGGRGTFVDRVLTYTHIFLLLVRCFFFSGGFIRVVVLRVARSQHRGVVPAAYGTH